MTKVEQACEQVREVSQRLATWIRKQSAIGEESATDGAPLNPRSHRLQAARRRLTRLLQRTRKLRFLAAEQHTRYASRTRYHSQPMNSQDWYTSLFLLFILVPVPCLAQSSVPEKTRGNFMVVVRSSIGANRTEDAFSPTGKLKAELPDGQKIEMEMASWEFIGDTHIRFVFDGPDIMLNATPQDLERLGIKNVEEALALALANIKRVYGEPSATPWEGGLMQVRGNSPDLNSSYFLDRAYWQSLLKAYPGGLVVSVPSRGDLLYVPLSDTKAVDGLKRGVAHLHASSESLRVSSALYLFKEGKWSVFQPPVKP